MPISPKPTSSNEVQKIEVALRALTGEPDSMRPNEVVNWVARLLLVLGAIALVSFAVLSVLAKPKTGTLEERMRAKELISERVERDSRREAHGEKAPPTG